ncbi:phasin family protein [Halomonas sp. NO4]|uniref:phasin family protein n=1 Tax=Halomonas sp. NO4 TaxID=2484813 RepID=UPI0013D07A65|nr:phasin family protein [Halomonas sp. NO4]
MSKTNSSTTQQFDTLFAGPARAYAALSLEFTEKLAAAQFEAARAYTDLSLAQARAWLDVKDVEGFKQIVESQQKVAQDLGNRVKGDAEKVVTLSQEFLQKGQKLTEENVKAASAAR